jgi:hypothetical protein
MVKLTRYQRLILKDIIRANGTLSAYTFYRRYRLSPAQLAESLNRLIINKLIQVKEDKILLTSQCKEWLDKRKISFADTEEKEWREIPIEVTQTKIVPWEPYLPSKKLLDKSFFPKT